MVTHPRVSVVIPLYNGAATIRRAIDSVLAQTYTDHEIIVVDDGSEDSTPDVLKGLPVHYIRQENQGTMAARQTGIDAAQGEFIALLDQDDAWLPDLLKRELAAFTAGVGLVLANMRAVDETGKGLKLHVVPRERSRTLSWTDYLLISPIATSTALFRKDTATKIGPLDTRFADSGALGDLDMVLRMLEVTELRFINKDLGLYTWSEYRPGRLFSFLDNLQAYHDKYASHPWVLASAPLRANFDRSCEQYALQLHGMLMKQYGANWPFTVLRRLMSNPILFEALELKRKAGS